jgi:hypothetical protein
MIFSILMNAIALLIKFNLKRYKFLRDMISVKNHKIVMVTKDGKSGKRFNICEGEFSTDNNLTDYDLVFIWKDGATAFKILTANDPTALHTAIANWDLELEGDESISIWFTIFLGYASGTMKKTK